MLYFVLGCVFAYVLHRVGVGLCVCLCVGFCVGMGVGLCVLVCMLVCVCVGMRVGLRVGMRTASAWENYVFLIFCGEPGRQERCELNKLPKFR